MTISPLEPKAISFSLHLFGPFAASVASRPMARLRSRKGQWILALLALRAGAAVEREWLAGTLWPENAEEKALYSLRRSLADLRQALEGEAWRIEAHTPRTLFLNLEDARVDVRVFDSEVKQADPAAWQRAVAVYTGPLLEGCTEEWVFQEREWREEAYLQTLERLAAESLRKGELARAAEQLRQVISLAPFRETAQRTLLQALAAQKDFAGVMLAYRDLRLRLRRELNAAPDQETTALLQQIRRAAQQHGEQTIVIGEHATAIPDAPLLLRTSSAESDPGEDEATAVDTEFAAPRCLPQPRTSFVGQNRVIADLCRSLAVHRLVTLTGTGGVGKTRLAVQAATETTDLFAGGTWLVDLAPLHDPALVLRTVAQTLDVSASPTGSLLEAVTGFFNGSSGVVRPPTLLLMDNCEHLLEACTEVVETLLSACPRLHILATSREALGLAGEVRSRIPSLPTPPLLSNACSSAEIAALPQTYPALRLFLERAQAGNPAFVLTVENAPAVAHICHMLDGIPLAIELAAARIRVMPPRTLAARLNNRFQLLVSEDKTGLPRHRTLRALIAWSVDLLFLSEQTVLRRLAVFRGGWTLQAAETICADEKQEGAAQFDVLDVLTSLIDKSLVLYDPKPDEERYSLLETIRQYAWQLMEETDSGRSIQERHFHCYLALVREADTGLAGSDQGHWLSVLEGERYNLDAALNWATTTPNKQREGLELAGLLARFWLMRGYWKEGRTWLERLLSLPLVEPQADAWPLWARAFNGAGALASVQGDHTGAQERYTQSLQAWQRAGDLRGQAAVLGNLGILALNRNDRLEARRLGERSLALRRRIKDLEGIANALSNLGTLAWAERDHVQTLAYYAESLALRRERNDLHGIATCLNNLGLVVCDQGNFTRADALFVESGTIFLTLEDRCAWAETLHSRADVAYRQQEDVTARTLTEESIVLFRALSERHGLRTALLLLARLAQRQGDDRGRLIAYQEAAVLSLEMGDHQSVGEILEKMAEGYAATVRPELAVRLVAAVTAWRSEQNMSPGLPDKATVPDTEVRERWKANLTVHLGEQVFSAAWMQGEQLTPEQALALIQTECVHAEFTSVKK